MSTIVGLPRLRAKLQHPVWVSRPTVQLIEQWMDFIKATASAGAPRWQGTLAGSFQSKHAGGEFPAWAEVWSNAPEASPMEFGTGMLSEAPDSKGGRHWPPGRALEPWARSKGLDPWAVAFAIGKRGGLAPRPYLRPAIKEAEGMFPGWLAATARQIEAQGSS
jgi:hypothetical protein